MVVKFETSSGYEEGSYAKQEDTPERLERFSDEVFAYHHDYVLRSQATAEAR